MTRPEAEPLDNRKPRKKHKEPGKHDPRSPLASSPAVVRIMQGNRGKDTKPELAIRRELRAQGVTGYRLHWMVPGIPDIAFPGRRVCVLVQGCYWHRCPRCQPHTPRTNNSFWAQKFARNVERDAEKQAALAELGWAALVVWECEINQDVVEVAGRIRDAVGSHPLTRTRKINLP